MRLAIAAVLLLPVFSAPSRAAGVDLVVELPAAAKVKTAVATNVSMKLDTAGDVHGPNVTFSNLLAQTPYDLRLTMEDGTVLQGVDLTWYIPDEPAKADVAALSDEDHEAIRAIVQDIQDFYNKKDILLLRGDHDRAVALTRLIRDTPFHSDTGGQVIWRIELWYFKFHYGGWEKVAQQNKVLRRERFPNAQAYQAATDHIRWMPDLGGIRLDKDKATTTLTIKELPK